MAEREDPHFGLGKSLLFSAILIAGLLTSAELLVRGWAYYLRESYERWDTATQTFVLVPGHHRTPGGTVEVNSQGFVGDELEPPGPDLWRIVAAGDSCTFGEGNAEGTYPAQLERLLASRTSARQRTEVVNAGVQGLNSELALRRLRTRVLPLRPDVVTLYVGWNDLMKFDPAAQADVERWAGLARALDKLWLARGMRKLFFFHLRPRVRPPDTGPGSRTGHFADFRPAWFEANLVAMIDAARGAGARVLVMTLPSVVREGMDLAALRRANVIFPYFRSAYRVGDLLDLIAAYNRSIRRVAREQDVTLVDLAKHFEAFADPVPYFLDTMHTNREGAAQIAQQLLEALVREDLLAATARGEAGRRVAR